MIRKLYRIGIYGGLIVLLALASWTFILFGIAVRDLLQ